MKASEYIPNYDLIAIGEWYNDGFFWRKKANNSWDKSDGKGDLIFNTCYKIFRDRDKSDWAYHAMVACSDLLLSGKRWHDRMNDDTDCKYWIQRIINRSTRDLLKVFGIKIHPKFRYQGRMTRDPFIALYLVCVFLERKQFIEVVKMPWYIYSPEVFRWRKRLIKDDRIDYKRRLGWLRANAVVMGQSEFN